MRIVPLSVLLSFLATHAYAGAWTQNAHQGQAIVTASYYHSTSLYDNQGNRRSQPAYSKYALNPYLEYGLTDDITLGTSLWLLQVHQAASAGNPAQSSWGLGDSEFFVRKRLWQEDGWVASLEPMVKLPTPHSPRNVPRLGATQPDAGLGLFTGYGFSTDSLNHFAEIGMQYRHRFGEPKDQVNISGTFGYSVTPGWMILPQFFMTYRTSSPGVAQFTQSSSDDYNLVKLQLSTVHALDDTLSVQVGGFSDIDGKNAGKGYGALLAVWKKF